MILGIEYAEYTLADIKRRRGIGLPCSNMERDFLIEIADNAAIATKWQPIETAPRDGTQCLVTNGLTLSIAAWNDEIRGPGVSRHIQKPGWVAYARGDEIPDEGWDTGNGYTMELIDEDIPIHWMPLPEPPK